MGRGERRQQRRVGSINWTCCDTVLVFGFIAGIVAACTCAYFVGRPFWDELRYQKTSCAIAHIRQVREGVECDKCFELDSSEESGGHSSRGHHGRGSHSGGSSSSSEESGSWEYDDDDWWWGDEDEDDWDLGFDAEAWMDELMKWLNNGCGVDLPDDVDKDWEEEWDWGSLLDDWESWRWERPDGPPPPPPDSRERDDGRGSHGSHSGPGWPGGPGGPGGHGGHHIDKRSHEEKICPVFDCVEVEVIYRDPKTGKSRFGMLYHTLNDEDRFPECSLSTCAEDVVKNANRHMSFVENIWATVQRNEPLRCYASPENPEFAIMTKRVSPMPVIHSFFWPALIGALCLLVILIRRCYYACGGKGMAPTDVFKQKVDPELRYMPSAGLPVEKAPLPEGNVQDGGDAGAMEKDPATLGEEAPGAKTGLWLVPPPQGAELPAYSDLGSQRWANYPPAYPDTEELPEKKDNLEV